MKITLIRHGLPSFAIRGWCAARDLPLAVQSYDAAEIVDRPPQASIAALHKACYVITSDLPRARSSLRAMNGRDPHESDELFREVAIPYNPGWVMKLPLLLWVIIFRLLWLVGYGKNGESIRASLHRAGLAAERLEELAGRHQHVCLVGHGIFNYMIGLQLRRRHWHGKACQGLGHWSFCEYHREE